MGFIAHFFVRRRQAMPAHVAPPSPSPSLPPPPPPPKSPPFRDHHVVKPLPQLDHLTDISVSSTTDCLSYVPSSPPPPPSSLQGRADLSRRLRLSPEERLKRQLSTQLRREREEQDALREEREREARRRREKEVSEQIAREDEERRKAVLDEHLRHVAARRARDEREARAAEERRLREAQERQHLERERRRQHSRALQKWRSDQIHRAESQSSQKEEERKRSTEERRSRIASLSDAMLHDGDAFNGWVTIQTHDQLAWKRRFFMFDLAHGQLSLYRSQQHSNQHVDIIYLDGQIEGLHEWYEGFEELEAIPHSLVVKFVDGRTWLMYADTEQDKDRILLLLSEAAGVII